MKQFARFAVLIAATGLASTAIGWEYRISTSDWTLALRQSQQRVARAVRSSDVDTLQRESHALVRLAAQVRSWPETDGPWTMARINSSLAAQSLSNYAEDMRRGGVRGMSNADGSLRDYRKHLDACKLASLKIEKGAN